MLTIHPLKIEQQVTGTETLYEGLAVFDPGALTPSCDSVKLLVYSEKDPQKADTRIVDARIVDQIGSTLLPTADATRSYSSENVTIP